MNTDEPTSERQSEPGEPGIESSEKNVNGVGPAPTYRAPARDVADLPAMRMSRLLKVVYWAVWFVVVPIVAASLLIWALTPPSGAEVAGPLGWLEGVVRAQPVPVGIVLFTVVEIVLWAARHQLPLAKHAHPPSRGDLPPNLRGTFERARALLDYVDPHDLTLMLKQR